jgi:hypothetical protein
MSYLVHLTSAALLEFTLRGGIPTERCILYMGSDLYCSVRQNEQLEGLTLSFEFVVGASQKTLL